MPYIQPSPSESWDIAAQMLVLLEQLRPLNARLQKLQERAGGAKPVPIGADVLDAVILGLKK